MANDTDTPIKPTGIDILNTDNIACSNSKLGSNILYSSSDSVNNFDAIESNVEELAESTSNINIDETKTVEIKDKDGNLQAILIYKNDLLDGTCQYYKDNQLIAEITYSAGKKYGESRYYNKSVLIRTENYIDDVKNGDCITYYDNEIPMIIERYKDGLLQGEQLKFYTNQVILEQSDYDGGIVKSTKKYYPSGNLQELQIYKNGISEGIWKKFYDKKNTDIEDNINIKEEVVFVEGVQSQAVQYDELGKVQNIVLK